MLSSSIIIATRNRPGPLEVTLVSLGKQTVQPEEAIIVDASDSDATARLVTELAPRVSFPLRYLRAEEPSSACQRNLGVEQASGDIVVFLDDDVELESEFLRELISPLEQETGVAGVSGLIVNQTYSQPRGLNRFLLSCCLNDNSPSWAGRLVGPAVNFLPAESPEGVRRVEWLFSTGTAYRKDIFRQYKFGQQFTGYSFAEDVHLSARVAQDWILLNTTRARFLHHDMGKDTHRDWAALGESHVINRHLIMTSVLKRDRFSDHCRLFAFEVLYTSLAWMAAGIQPERMRRLGTLMRGKMTAFWKLWMGNESRRLMPDLRKQS